MLRTLRDAWKVFKSRIKKKHYRKYDNDVERLKNKPSDIPLDEFKVLIKYWGSKKVQEIAEKNASNRKKIVDTHTAGTTSFAQISKQMELSNENGEAPSKVEMFIATRKRKDGQDYKSPTELINYKLSSLQEICSSGANSNSIEQFIGSEASHWSSFLVGKRALPKKPKTSSTGTSSELPIDVEQLTARIEENLHVKVEETVNQRVTDKMSLVRKKLNDKYPDLAIDLDDFEVSSEHDDNVSI